MRHFDAPEFLNTAAPTIQHGGEYARRAASWSGRGGAGGTAALTTRWLWAGAPSHLAGVGSCVAARSAVQ